MSDVTIESVAAAAAILDEIAEAIEAGDLSATARVGGALRGAAIALREGLTATEHLR